MIGLGSLGSRARRPAPFLSMERAELLTEFYKQNGNLKYSVPVTRALALKHLLLNKSIAIEPGELIVGERGPSPRAAPTFPELCCHTLEDLQVMNSRERTPFKVTTEARKIQEEIIIPFWSGRSMRDRIFNAMTPEWIDSFNAGIFTEFMEQRAPGHAVMGDKVYKRGLNGLKNDIKRSLDTIDWLKDPQAYGKSEELKAMEIAADAVTSYAKRYSELAKELAETEVDPQRKIELTRISEVCSRVPAEPPRDFWETLQAYWFCHIGIVTELNTWDSYCPGRLDQHLIKQYREGLKEGTLNQEDATELLRMLLG